MPIAEIGPAPTPEEWERRLRTDPPENLLTLHQHSIQMLGFDNKARSPLVGIAERVMRERGISID